MTVDDGVTKTVTKSSAMVEVVYACLALVELLRLTPQSFPAGQFLTAVRFALPCRIFFIVLSNVCAG